LPPPRGTADTSSPRRVALPARPDTARSDTGAAGSPPCSWPRRPLDFVIAARPPAQELQELGAQLEKPNLAAERRRPGARERHAHVPGDVGRSGGEHENAVREQERLRDVVCDENHGVLLFLPQLEQHL